MSTLVSANPLFQSPSLLVEGQADSSTVWAWMRNGPVQCYSLDLLKDLDSAFSLVVESAVKAQYAVVGSATPGIYNFGGDLGLFAALVRNQDLQALVDYGIACIRCSVRPDLALEQGVITIALVQGDALGGGFEAALACPVIVAERGATMGLPETLFNLFPGMGAMHYIARRTNPKLAQDLMLSGRTFPAEEAFEMGLVDVLAEPGEGRLVVERYIQENTSRHNGRVGVLRARNAAFPVTFEALEEVVKIWAEMALNLTARDLKLMERLVKAQAKRWQPGA